VKVLFALIVPVVCSAHDLEAVVTLAAPAVIVRAAYGGSEPVQFAKVQVFAPAATQEFQTGVTDRRGCFSFVPDGPGAWRVMVDDEEGHKREIEVKVPSPFEGVAHTPAEPGSRVERALLGVALMVGATGFLYGFKARRESRD
jgi:nickel transport protein